MSLPFPHAQSLLCTKVGSSASVEAAGVRRARRSDAGPGDPAAGTGAQPPGAISHALGRAEAEQCAGSVPGYEASLVGNLYGFEFVTGPYAVAESRVKRAVQDRGAEIPVDGRSNICLTDASESPHASPAQLPLFQSPISDQRARAQDAKSRTQVHISLGGPHDHLLNLSLEADVMSIQGMIERLEELDRVKPPFDSGSPTCQASIRASSSPSC